ncbi:MAG: tape measure protein [Pigmentiphaga sp.]|nr:tape measure protein [Pigmentiphaga sp.]
MATVLEELLIALRVDDGKLKRELARIVDQSRKAGAEGEKALKPFETGLSRMAAEARAGLRPLSDLRDELKKQAGELTKLAAAQDKNSGEYRQTVEQLTSVKRELASVTTELKTQESLFDKLGGTMTRVGGVLSLGVTAPLTILGATGVRSAQQLEVFQRSLETLTGNAEAARDVFEELYEFDTSTTFSWPSLTKATTLLAAFNVESQDLIPTLSRLGDISAAVNMNIDELAEIYGKAKVQGRLFMEDINQLSGRGIPIVQELAAQFGVAESEIRGMVAEGKVGFSDIEQAFVTMTSEGGRFFEMMKTQTDTSEGRMMALRKEFEQVTDMIGDALLPTVDRLVGVARDAVKWFVDLDESTRQLIINVGLFAAALGPLLIGLGQAVRVVGQLRTAFVALRAAGLLMAGPTGWVVLGVAAIGGLAIALSGKPDSLDRSLEKAGQALAGGDAKSLKTALGNITRDLAPESPLRKELEGFQRELERTGEVGVEAADAIAEALRQVPIEAARARLALAEANVAAARSLAFGGDGQASVPSMTAGEALGPLKDRVAALGRADLSERIQWRPDLNAFGFEEGFQAKGVSVEIAELFALATREVRGEGDRQVARVTAAETAEAEARAALEALLNPSSGTDTGAGKTPPPVVPNPGDTKKDAEEVIGILNTLNSDIAELQRQRMAATSAADILALEQAITQKRAEYEYWDNLNKRDLIAAPDATVTPAVGIPAPGATAGDIPLRDVASPAMQAMVADFDLSIRDVERLARNAWEEFSRANSEEDRRRWSDLAQHYESLKEEMMRPFTPQPIAAPEPFAALPETRGLSASGVMAGALPFRDIGMPGVFAGLDQESTAFVAKVRGDLSAAMDLAASKAAALGDAYDLPREQMSLMRAAVMELIENGLDPASPAVQEFVDKFGELGKAIAEAAAQEARLKAFGEAMNWARDALGEMPGPLEANIDILQKFRDSLEGNDEETQKLREEIDRLVAALLKMKGIQDSGLRKFAGDVRELSSLMPGLGGVFARSTADIAEGLHLIAETDNDLEGVALIIRGVANAIEGLSSAASDGGLNGNQVMELIGGIAGVAGEAIGALTGIPGLGQVVSAAFQLITAAVGDLGNGLQEIQEQIDQTVKSTPLVARETLDAFASEYTRRVSRGGIAGSFGGTKAELDQEMFDAAVELAGSFANTFATALASADFAGSLDLGFDRMIRDQLIEAFILSPEVQAQIKALVEFWQEAWADGTLDDEERKRWERLKQGLIDSGQATREQLRELGLLEDEQAKKARAGGARITDLTGPARDHFADLLAPLRNLGAQLTALQDIRNILDARLPKVGTWSGATAAPGGGQTVYIDTVKIDRVSDARSLFDELSRIAGRLERGR